MFTGRVNKIVDRVLLKKHGANAMIYKPKDGTEILAQIKLYEKEREQNGRADGQAGRWSLPMDMMALWHLISYSCWRYAGLWDILTRRSIP